MPIPNKGFFDPDPEPESLQHHEETRAAFKAVIEQQDKEQEEINAKLQVQQEERKQQAREDDIKRLEQYADISRDQLTRDMILERIRRMREDKPQEIVPPPLSKWDKERLEMEQQAGREALARVQAMMKPPSTEVVASEMTPVHHPNPSQDEIYPTVKSTLPPKPRR
jgi:hypothetical protein